MRPWKPALVFAFVALSISLSIALVVSIARHTRHSAYVLSRVTTDNALGFPSVLVCPTYVPEFLIPPTEEGFKPSFSVAARTYTPAFVNDIDEVGDGYAVCGKTVTFIDPKHNNCHEQTPEAERDCRMYECLSIDADALTVLTREQVGERLDATCEFDKSILQKFPVAYTVNDSPRNLHAYDLKDPWTANRTSATLKLEVLVDRNVFSPNASEFLPDFPLQIMLYGEKTRAKPPSSFQEFQSTFSLTGAGSLLSFYTNSVQWVHLKRGVRQRDASTTKNVLAKDSPCDVETWDSSETRDYSRGMSSGTDALMLLMSFATLDTTHTCYQAIFDATDGAGLFGGFISIFGLVLFACVWAFKMYNRVRDGSLGTMEMQSALLGYDDEEPLFQ